MSETGDWVSPIAGNNQTSRATSGATVRKQKRIPKACDVCRVRKIKCSGKSPCLSCLDNERECVFSQGATSRNVRATYIRELEQKVRNLRSLLSTRSDIDANNGPISGNSLALQDTMRCARDSYVTPSPCSSKRGGTEPPRLEEHDELLDTGIEATSRFNVNGLGHYEYYANLSGLGFVHGIANKCGEHYHPDLVVKPHTRFFLHSARAPAQPWVTSLLPSQTVAQRLTKIALEDASCLMVFIHQPSFDYLLNRVYDLSVVEYTDVEKRFLPLLFVTLAIGVLFSANRKDCAVVCGKTDRAKGKEWFDAGQTLLDITHCRDINSLQALVCMIIYLQSSALMRTCYTYISIGVSASLQMGLHRSEVLDLLDPVQQEIRKRTFWVLLSMETYVTTLLGLPLTVADKDIDQELPLDVDDVFITTNGVLVMPNIHISKMAIVNAHTKLVMIMRKIIRQIYPGIQKENGQRKSHYINYALVMQVEADLQNWFQNLPSSCSDPLAPPEILRMQLILRLVYAHVQMVLRRPFLHHILQPEARGHPEIRSHACALACIKAAMQIVWLIDEIDKRELLTGAYWFTAYITLFAVMSLCAFVLTDPNHADVEATFEAAKKGHELLSRLAINDASAERCVACLGNLIDKASHVVKRSYESSLPNLRDSTGPNFGSLGSESSGPHPVLGHVLTAPFDFLENDVVFRGIQFQESYNQTDYQQQPDILAMMCPIVDGFDFQFDSSLHPQAYTSTFVEEEIPLRYFQSG